MAGVSAVSAQNHSRGIEFLLGVDLAFTVYSGTNSSPQTTDVFGDPTRLESLWKYVRIGGVMTLVCVAIASWLDRSVWPVVGGVFAGSVMHGLYHHAAGEARRRNGVGMAGSPQEQTRASARSDGPVATPRPR